MQTLIRQQIETIALKIARNYRPEKIILFGSYAYGQPQEGSDADLLIIKATSEKFWKRGLTIRKLLNWEEDALVSPVVLTPQEIQERLQRGDQFVAEILQRGQLLYEQV